jgi:hypothetical protein
LGLEHLRFSTASRLSTLVAIGSLSGLLAWFGARVASAQAPVPLADDVRRPLLPTGILPYPVRIEGELAYLWEDDEGEHVIHAIGDFSMAVGERSFTAQQAVIWMKQRTYEGRRYLRFEIALLRNARIVEPAGTVTDGPLLFATLSSSGEVLVSADRRTFASSADTAAYRDALLLRRRIRAGPPEEPPDTVVPEPSPEGNLPSPVFYGADKTTLIELEDGRPAIVASGNVHVFRSDPTGESPLELRADSAVVFLKPDEGAGPTAPLLRERGALEETEAPPVEGVYLEGDIRMSLGERRMRASRLYYDLMLDRALILDAVLFGKVPERNLPVYVRADRIRQLSERAYAADDAVLTTSEFHTPHYHVGAGRIRITDKSAPMLGGDRLGLARAGYEVRDATFNLYNVPLLYWPRAAGDVRFGDTPIRGISIGASDTFGATIETEWDLFNLLSLEPPRGFSNELRLDYYGKRGPGAGLDLEYERDHSFGLVRSYVIEDHGDDNLGDFRDNKRDDGTRGRLTLRHRQYLPEDWELTLEFSYLSDRNFLEQYFEHEFDTDKEQETLLYLKKQRDNWAFTALAQFRINDFLTQTESLPDFSFRLIGEPLGDHATWFSENRAGIVRYRAAEKDFYLLLIEGSDKPSSGSNMRADSRQEVEFPFPIGPVNVVPFLTLRGTAWDDSPASGGLSRGFASLGIRSAMYFSRVFPDVRNRLLDVDGIRHIIKPELVAWIADSNRDSDELYPFDDSVEGINDFDGVKLGVRQRWQTKRGPADRRRVVDWITLDVELGVFNDAPGDAITNGFVSYSRPEESVARNYLGTEFTWRINDATILASEMNYDINDGEVDIFNVALAVERSPRFSYLFGYRFIEEIDSNLLGFGMNYKIDEKHMLAFREEFDLDRGDTLDFSIGYVRKFPRWYVAVTFDLDESKDDAGVSISAWPEGLPRAALGSRRFTGLATATTLARD